MAYWSDLPRDLLGQILERLAVVDHIRFKAVCTSWGLAVGEKLYRPEPQIPWLMLFPREEGGNGADPNPITTVNEAGFLSLSEKKLYKADLLNSPQIRGKLCIGSSHGWLITVDTTANIRLLNPLTGAQIQLPPVTTVTYPRVEVVRDPSGSITEYLVEQGKGKPPYPFTPESFRDCYSHKAVLSSSPSATSPSYYVVLIHGNRNLSYSKVGDSKWTLLKSPRSRAFQDAIYHKGLLHTLSVHGLIESWDLDIPSPKPTVIVDATPENLFIRHCDEFYKYLVEVGGDLVQVWREERYWKKKYNSYFRVFRFDRRKSMWVHTKSLPNHAIFVGHNSSFSLSTRDFPELKGNCIYFTDNSMDIIFCGPCSMFRMGVYNLRDPNAIEHFYPPQTEFDWPPPVWYMPNLL